MQHPSQPGGPRGDEKVLFPEPKVTVDEHNRIAAERRNANKEGLPGIFWAGIVAIVIIVGYLVARR